MKFKLKSNELMLFCMVFGVSLYYMIKNSIIYAELFKIILFLANCFGVIYILSRKKISKKLLLLYSTFLAISVYYFILLRNFSILTIFLFIVVCSEFNNDKIIEWLFWINAFLLIVFQFLKIGTVSNTFGLQVGIILLMYICVKKGDLKCIAYIIWASLIIVVAIISSSKATGIISMIALAGTLLSKSRIGKKMLKSKAVLFIFPICCFANFFFAACLANSNIPIIGAIMTKNWINGIVSFAKLLDAAMSWRLSLTNQSLKYFGYSLFGRNIDVESLHLDQYSYFYLDSGYANILQGWGLVFGILLLILMTVIIQYFIKIERYDLIISSICIALWSVNEPILNLVTWNFVIIYGGQAIYYFSRNRKRLPIKT